MKQRCMRVGKTFVDLYGDFRHEFAH